MMFADHSRVSGGQKFGSFRAYITVTYPFRTREEQSIPRCGRGICKGRQIGLGEDADQSDHLQSISMVKQL